MSIVNCKLTKLHSCFYLFIPGRLLSFSFVVLGSSCCGSSLNQWLAHLIGLTELLVMYIYVVCGLDQAPFFIISESSVHEYESSLRLGYCGIRGGVRFRLPAFHGGGFTYRASSSWDVLCPLAFLVALGVAFGSTLPVKRSLGCGV